MSQPRAAVLATGLVALFLLSLAPAVHHAPVNAVPGATSSEVTPVGQSQKLTIGSWPDGANQRVEISVPDGHSIKSLDLDVRAGTLTNSMGSVLTDVGDFSSAMQYDLSLIHI